MCVIVVCVLVLRLAVHVCERMNAPVSTFLCACLSLFVCVCVCVLTGFKKNVFAASVLDMLS